MKSGTLAKRYAKALFSLAVDNRTQDRVLNELRALNDLFHQDKDIKTFFASPVVSGVNKEKAVEAALAGRGVSAEVHQFALLLAKKDRLPIFYEVVDAFQSEIDSSNNVCRGAVRSTMALGPAERFQIEQTVERVLSKKVIMTYKVDPTVIGGLVAQVGSYKFDDSLSTHLKRMNEELKRRTV